MLLLAGMSLSASAATMLNESVIGFSDFASQQADFGSKLGSETFTTDGNNLTMSVNGLASFTGRVTLTVTMVLDLTQITTPDAYTTLFQTVDSGNASWGVGLTTDRTLQGLWQGAAFSGGPTTEALASEGQLTISVVTGDSGTRIYLGSNDNFYTKDSLKFSNSTVNGLLMDKTLSEAVEQLYVHDSALTEEQVGQLMTEIASVPEPATASLSLLGLVALMMRRRRA